MITVKQISISKIKVPSWIKYLEKFSLGERMAALSIFTNGLGFVIYVHGINIVNFLSIATILSIIAETMINNKRINDLLRGRKRFFLFFYVFWILYATFQPLFISIHMEEYKIGYRQIVTNFIMIFFVCYVVRNRNTFFLILYAFTGILFVNVLLGLYEITTGNYFYDADMFWNQPYARGLSVNPNNYATTLYCALMGMVLLSTGKRWGLFMKILSLGAVVCILSSHSRGILLALIIFVLLYLFMDLYVRLKGRAFLGKVLSFSVMLVAVFLLVSGNIQGILHWLVNTFSDRGDHMSDLYRLSLIKQGMEYFSDSYGFGVGAGQSVYLAKMDMHNFVIEILAEYGIFIFLGIILIFWRIWENAFNIKLDRKTRCIYFAFIPSLLMASVVASSVNRFKIFWIMILMFYLSRDHFR